MEYFLSHHYMEVGHRNSGVCPSLCQITFLKATPQKPFDGFCSKFEHLLVSIYSLSNCVAILIQQIQELWVFNYLSGSGGHIATRCLFMSGNK